MSTPQRRLTPRVLGPEIIIFAAVLAAPIFILAFNTMRGKFSPLFIVGGVVTIQVTAIFFFLRSLFRVRRLLRRHGRFLCLNCLYPLEGLPDTGRCPECSTPYDRAELERLWKNWEVAVNKGKEMAKPPKN